MKIINVENSIEKLKEGKAILIDVRTQAEFNDIHAKDAIHVPLDKIDEAKKIIEKSKKDILIICKSGQRSQMACHKINSSENNNIYSVEGGTLAWIQHNLEIVKGTPKWDIERQVRFTAGFLIVIGIILGHFLNNWIYLFSAFVGLGLMFAAVTNTCAMGMILMKLPYNQSKNFSLDKLKSQI